MAADQGRRDQLHHGVTGHTTFAEIHDLALAKTLHPDELAQLNDVALDVVSITDEVGIAVLEIDGGAEAPCLAGSYHVLDR